MPYGDGNGYKALSKKLSLRLSPRKTPVLTTPWLRTYKSRSLGYSPALPITTNTIGEISELGMDTLAPTPTSIQPQQVMPNYGYVDDDDDMTMSLVGYVPDHSRDDATETENDDEMDNDVAQRSIERLFENVKYRTISRHQPVQGNSARMQMNDRDAIDSADDKATLGGVIVGRGRRSRSAAT